MRGGPPPGSGYPRGVTETRETADILQRAADGGRISPDEALLLYTDAPLHALGEAADAVRRRRYPDNIGALEDTIARKYGAKAENVLIATGSGLILQAAVMAFASRSGQSLRMLFSI